eukprot:GHVR01074961.1.p1 GENE.GHVR01074961.1~~GHVR01074961.1.p1  ORF type:complete len:255 (+),score=70.69 GHVR01074961.1:142-906(+)
MSSDVIGDVMDIHTGGCDLKFPHHDNEIAQSEAFCGRQQCVNYFLHCGHLHIEGQKMSKSLKNFISIKETLNSGITPRQLRILFLSHMWDKDMDFSSNSKDAAVELEKTLFSFFATVKALERQHPIASSPQPWSVNDSVLQSRVCELKDEVHTALQDSLDTPRALRRLREIVSVCHTYLKGEGANPRMCVVGGAARYVVRMLKVFGAIDGSDELPGLGGEGGESTGGGAGGRRGRQLLFLLWMLLPSLEIILEK